MTGKIIEQFDYDEFQYLKYEVLDLGENNELYDYSLSSEIFLRDLTNIIFLLKGYNEDLKIDFLMNKEFIENINKKIWIMRKNLVLNLQKKEILKINKNVKNIYKKSFVPFDKYYLYKKDNSLRKITIPCLDMYVNFIIRTLQVYEDFFLELNIHLKKMENLNLLSPLINEEAFTDSEYSHLEKIFTDNIVILENQKKKTKISIENEYCLYIDIENFYSSIYVHDIQRLKMSEFFKQFENLEVMGMYLDFLHDYNMKINNCETRGIITGPFSSTITSELILMAIDFEINKIIVEKQYAINYTRYADDYNFYSDNLSELEEFEFLLLKVFISYNLKTNKSKRMIKDGIESIKSIHSYNDDILVFIKDENSNIIIDFEKLNNFLYILKNCVYDSEYNNFKIKCRSLINNLPDEFEENEYLYNILLKFLISIVIKFPHLTRDIFRIIDKINSHNCFSKCLLDDKFVKTKGVIIEKKYHNSLLYLLFDKYFIKEKLFNITKINDDVTSLNYEKSKKNKLKLNFFIKHPLYCSIYIKLSNEKNEYTEEYNLLKDIE